MGLDILGALKRMVTLPKASNSLADVLGPEIANAWKEGLKVAVLHAVDDGILNAAGQVGRIEDQVLRSLDKAFGGKLDPLVKNLILNAVADAVNTNAAASLNKLSIALYEAINKALKLV